MKKKVENYKILFRNRKTLEIAVHPNQEIIVSAPIGSDISEIHKKVDSKKSWIRMQLNFFEKFEPRAKPRIYVGGESHLYLGNSYRLKIVYSMNDIIKVTGKYLVIYTNLDSSQLMIKDLLKKWYFSKAIEIINSIYDEIWESKKHYFIDFNKPKLKIQTMKTRWGSISSNGILRLNSDLIRADKLNIEYVIYHELSHLLYQNHDKNFYKLLSILCPDWQNRKENLETLLS